MGHSRHAYVAITKQMQRSTCDVRTRLPASIKSDNYPKERKILANQFQFRNQCRSTYQSMQCQYCISLFVAVVYQQERHYRYRTSMTMPQLSCKTSLLDRERSIRRILLTLLCEPSCTYDISKFQAIVMLCNCLQCVLLKFSKTNTETGMCI